MAKYLKYQSLNVKNKEEIVIVNDNIRRINSYANPASEKLMPIAVAILMMK